MSEFEQFGAQVKRALGPAGPDPGLRSRVMAAVQLEARLRRPNRAQWAMGAVAVVLTVAIAGGSFLATTLNRHRPAAPVGHVTLIEVGDLSCRLPITGLRSAAYINFPDGALSLEPSVRPVGPNANAMAFSYVGPAQAWVPVPAGWVSTDGRSYACTTQTTGVPGAMPTGSVHVVDVKTHKDREVWSGAGYGQVIGWSSGLLYVQLNLATETGAFGGGGVHSIDPNSGTLKRITSDLAKNMTYFGGFSSGPVIGAGGLFAAAFPALQTTPKAGPGTTYGPPSTLVRTDLRDGSQSTWYTAPECRSLQLLGLDRQNRLLISLQEIPAQPAAPDLTRSYFEWS